MFLKKVKWDNVPHLKSRSLFKKKYKRSNFKKHGIQSWLSVATATTHLSTQKQIKPRPGRIRIMLLFTIPTSRTQLNHALACVAIISSSVTAYQLDDKLVSKLGQLLDPYNSDLANVQVGTVLSYGCWCHFDVKLIGGNKTVFLHTKGRGNAVDELDQNCKILASGYRCGVLDADPTACQG